MAYVFFEAIPEQKIAYLIIRKSGCTSIRDAFESVRASLGANGPVTNRTKLKLSDVPPDWFCFTFVREPVRRFLSFFANKIASSNQFGSVFLDCQTTGFQPNMSLDQAIEVLTCGHFSPEAHVQSQAQIIAQAGTSLDFVGRLETFADDLATVNRKAQTTIPRLHRNPNGQLPIAISPDQYQRLATHFQEDIKQFNYPSSFAAWNEFHGFTPENMRPSSSIYQFGNQATLLRSEAFCEPIDQPKTIRMDLTWQLSGQFNHVRLARLLCVQKEEDGSTRRNILLNLEHDRNLAAKADRDGIAEESIEVSLDALPDNCRLESVLMDLCLWTKSTRAVPLLNYGNPRSPQFRLELPVLSWLNRFKQRMVQGRNAT